MTKVCLISNNFSSKGSGVGVYSRNLYNGLKDDKSLNVSRIELDISNSLKYLLNPRVRFFRVPDGDIYHALAVSYIIPSRKDKTVVTIHDLVELDPIYNPYLNIKGKIFEKLKKFDERKLALKCRHIITSSKDTKSKLNSLYGVDLDRISVVRFGFIDENLFSKNKETETYNIGT
ncbi:MAG: glycosyltransferase, partial [Methanobrevibacter sp.]|nr:glycosyltransferase [Candidatus Methanovirga basalitermitum]